MLNKIPVPEDPVTIDDLFFEVAKLRKRVEVMELMIDLLLLDPKMNIKKNYIK